MEERIIAFLLRAKRAGCAEESGEFCYQEGTLSYRDSKLGVTPFAGQQVVYEEAAPCWAMNTLGRVTGEGFDAAFLGRALRQATIELPYRGPRRYDEDGMSYWMNVEGDAQWFYGYEQVLVDGQAVYECAFHGGTIA